MIKGTTEDVCCIDLENTALVERIVELDNFDALLDRFRQYRSNTAEVTRKRDEYIVKKYRRQYDELSQENVIRFLAPISNANTHNNALKPKASWQNAWRAYRYQIQT